VIDAQKTAERLKNHLKALTQTIGERSVFLSETSAQETLQTASLNLLRKRLIKPEAG